MQQHWKAVEADLGADDGVLRVDGSDCPQQGDHAVGVKRQDCGELGKRANCQAGVLVGYGSLQGYTMRDRRLSVPVEGCTDDAYTGRRRQWGLPPDLPFHTQPALAQEMRAAVVKSQTRRCRWVVADEAFGGNPGFLDGVAGLACGILLKCPTPRASGKSARPPPSR